MAVTGHEERSFDWHEPGLTIGEVSARSGVAPSALRFYERKGLITTERDDSRQRRYRADVLCRIAMIRASQEAGLTLTEIKAVLAMLPEGQVPSRADWNRIAAILRHDLRLRIARFERVLAALAPTSQ